MHDAAYKDLFSRPRMVEDLLRGFAAREWSDALDLSTLEKLPAEYVSDDLRRRHGDAVWRVRFRDRKWLYLLVMLEFQSTTDRYMAVRILVYTALPYQDLIRRGELGGDGRLPPVLPVAPYNGRPRWTAPVEAGDLIAPAGEALAPFQLSQRYFLLDEGRWGEDDLPRRNLAAALVALENSGSAESLSKLLGALSDWLRDSEDDELRRAFVEWVRQAALPGPVPRGRAAGGAGAGRRRSDAGGEREGMDRSVVPRRPGTGARTGSGARSGTGPGTRACTGSRAGHRTRARRRTGAALPPSSPEVRRRNGRQAGGVAGIVSRTPNASPEVGEWIIECGTEAELLDRAGR